MTGDDSAIGHTALCITAARLYEPFVARLRRFEKEARSASSLNHPSIVTIFEIAQADSVAYMAMELMEGKTLRKLLAPDP